jgi:selenocysteine lyase/cysteine desulfurase
MNIARRDFLKLVSSASVAGSFGAWAVNAGATTSAVPGFGFADDSVPMNAANLCPMPSAVTEAHNQYAMQLDRSLSTASRRSIEAFKEEARSRVAAMLGVSGDEIAIVRNASEANGTIVQGFPLDAGDEVVLWDQNHPSNLVAWEVQAARTGATVRRFAVPVNIGSIDEVVDLFLSVVGANTRVVSFTHISNVTGFKLPLAEICAALRRKKGDVFIHVDGAQTWGAVDINLGGTEADSLSGSAHKWFMGPREVGILYLRERHISRIWPNIVSVPWGITPADAPTGARKFDALSQRDDAAIASLNDAALYHETITPAGIEAQSKAVADRLRAGLLDLGVGFVSSNNPSFTSSVVIIQAPQERADSLVGKVFDDAGVQCAATGGFRMSPHIYNTADHVDRVIGALKKNQALLA